MFRGGGGTSYIIGGMIYDMIHFIGGMIYILDPKYRHILDLKVHPTGGMIHILDLKVHPIDALRGARSVNGGGVVQAFGRN